MKQFFLAAAVAAAMFGTGCDTVQSKDNKTTEKTEASPTLTQAQLAERGHYLVDMMGCNDCHSPMIMTPQGPARDPERLLSGHPSQMPLPVINKKELQHWVLFSHSGTAMAGPWGVSFAGNLTSDTTGIGLWTEAQFANALRNGKFKGLDGGRELLPPMPWQNYKHINDEDLKAIFAYLKSTKPVKNVVPAPISL